MERGYILSIDQSTQGTKAILLDGQGSSSCAGTCPTGS